jgi:hypothetical protein
MSSTNEEMVEVAEECCSPDKPLVQLWGARRFGLIVLTPSGVYYSNQTGGHACYHPTVEGVFIPLGAEDVDQEKDLCEYFTGPKWAGWCCEGIDEETAAFIDSILAKSHLTKHITVDRTHLTNSHEAWVHVDFRNTQPYGYGGVEVSGFGVCKGVLTWENSD